MDRVSSHLGPRRKAELALRIWLRFVPLLYAVKRYPLPTLVERLGHAPRRPSHWVEPRRLGRIVGRVLRLGPFNPRCLYTSLVLYRLLHEEGEPAKLVIGLPLEPKDKDAHAWVEVAGMDVGPPPGRANHQELARFG